jgi:hypothetical protein
MAFLDVLFVVADAEAPGLGAGAGSGDEPAESQDCLIWGGQPVGDHGGPEG